MTPTPRDILGQIAGGRVLDVATGTGGFIHFLLEGLKDYNEIIGVDNAERRAEAFEEAFRDKPNICFEVQDACRLDFADSAFDTVCISNSLHHLDVIATLREVKRVLRPGGALLVSEMYRDGQTETQMTHVLLHHWWGAVDIVNGVAHRETYLRSEILELVRGLDLADEVLYDLSDLDSDPKDPAILAELDPVFERYIQRAEGHPDLQRQGEQLRKRVQAIGFHSATTLLMIGRKQ
ncbi:MAG: class I SAM-dependent methyltransferase [Chloroflexota bacterium]|nr:class I SAM-dependent methyltransferase [Anaerolineales bacterium]